MFSDHEGLSPGGKPVDRVLWEAAVRREASGPLAESAFLARELAASLSQLADDARTQAFRLELLDAQIRQAIGGRWWTAVLPGRPGSAAAGEGGVG